MFMAVLGNGDGTYFNLLEPMADGFRNYSETRYTISKEELLLDKS